MSNVELAKKVVEHEFAYPDPWAISPQLQPQIETLGLGDSVGELKDEGYAIVDGAYDLDFCDSLRAAIIEEAEKQQGGYFNIQKGDGLSAYHLLGRNDLFAQALLNPKLRAIAEYLCGADYQLSQLSGSVRYQGAAAMDLHMDAQWIPPTDYNPLFTACLALEDLEPGSGPTRVIPKTHLLKRNPDAQEAMDCGPGLGMLNKKGGFSVWSGYTWHSNFARELPGERVMLHMTFCRLAHRPVEDYSNVSDEYLAKFSPELATMVGRNSWFGLASRDTGKCDMEHYMRSWTAARS